MKHLIIVGAKSAGLNRFAENLCRDQKIRLLKYLFDRSDYDAMAELDRQGLLPKIGDNLEQYLENIIGDECSRAAIALSYEELIDWNQIWSYLSYCNADIIHWKQEDYLPFYIEGKNQPLLVDTDDLIACWVEMQEIWEEMNQRIGYCHEVWEEDLDQEGYDKLFEFLNLENRIVQYTKIDVKSCILNWEEVDKAIKEAS